MSRHIVTRDVPEHQLQKGDIIEKSDSTPVVKRAGRVVEGLNPDPETISEAVRPLSPLND